MYYRVTYIESTITVPSTQIAGNIRKLAQITINRSETVLTQSDPPCVRAEPKLAAS